MEEQRRLLRKYDTTLSITGKAVIVFALWSIAKNLYRSLEPDSWLQELFQEYADLPHMDDVLIVMLTVLVGVDLCIRVYIGTSAMSATKRGYTGILYLILAGLCLLADLAGVIWMLVDVHIDGYGPLIATAIADLTSIWCLADLLMAGIRCRRLVRDIGAQAVVED